MHKIKLIDVNHKEINVDVLNLRCAYKDGLNYFVIENSENKRGLKEYILRPSEFFKLKEVYLENCN